MKNFTEYNFTQRMGMEGIGDMEMEWLTPKEQEERWEQRRIYVEKCKADGSYGKEYTTKIFMQHDPALDSPVKHNNKSFTSSSIILHDITIPQKIKKTVKH